MTACPLSRAKALSNLGKASPKAIILDSKYPISFQQSRKDGRGSPRRPMGWDVFEPFKIVIFMKGSEKVSQV
jgi:hypothetical protein